MTLELIGSVETELVEAEASTVNLKLTSAPNQKIVDVLNAIGYTYVERHMNDRRLMLDRTIRHMRMNSRATPCRSPPAATVCEAFLTAEGITHLNTRPFCYWSAVPIWSARSRTGEGQVLQLSAQPAWQGTKGDKPISPKAVGIQDEIPNEMTERLVALQTDITLLEQENKTANPNYERMVRQMEQQRQNILGSVEGFTASNDLRLANVNERLGRMKSQDSAVPRNERTLSDKQRDQRVIEAPYTDLVLRSANLRIVRSSLEPEVKVTTPAYHQPGARVPEPQYPLHRGLPLSFMIPLGYLVGKSLLGDRVQGPKDILKVLPVRAWWAASPIPRSPMRANWSCIRDRTHMPKPRNWPPTSRTRLLGERTTPSLWVPALLRVRAPWPRYSGACSPTAVQKPSWWMRECPAAGGGKGDRRRRDWMWLNSPMVAVPWAMRTLLLLALPWISSRLVVRTGNHEHGSVGGSRVGPEQRPAC